MKVNPVSELIGGFILFAIGIICAYLMFAL